MTSEEKFSLFEGGITQTVPTQEISILDLVNLIKGGRYAEKIKEFRSKEVGEEKSALKTALDYFVISGVFSNRNNSGLQNSSGYLILDFDDIKDSSIRTKLENSPYTHVLFESPSRGLKVIVKCPKVADDFEHKTFIFSCFEEYDKITDVDRSGSDISRACFVSHDPNIFHNPNSLLWEKKADLSDYLEDLLKRGDSSIVQNHSDPLIQKIKSSIKISSLLKTDGYDLTKNPTECLFGHPSKGKKNFSYNDKLGLWHCFHTDCNLGGDVLSYVMFRDKVSFPEAISSLTKNLFDDLEEFALSIKDCTSERKNELFEDFKKLIPLSSKHAYSAAFIAFFYSLQGAMLKKRPLCVGTFRLDTRLNYVISIMSSGGKDAFRRLVKKTAELLEDAFVLPSKKGFVGLIPGFHEEQLVGKNVRTKKGDLHEYPGHLASYFLVCDDAVPLINDLQKESCRSYLMTAANMYPTNEIYKKLTEQHAEDALKYPAECTAYFFVQPVPLVWENLRTGFDRRYPILHIDLPSSVREETVKNALRKPIFNPSFDSWVEHLTNLHNFTEQNKNKDYVFTEDAIDLIDTYHKVLVDYFEAITGPRSFGENRRMSIVEDLLRYSAIVSVMESSDKITGRHVRIAFKDYYLVAQASFQHFINYVKPKKLVIKKGPQEQMVIFLRENACLSESTSTISIADFKNKIEQITNLSSSAVNYHYKMLRKQGLISSKQFHQGDTKVWLTETNKVAR